MSLKLRLMRWVLIFAAGVWLLSLLFNSFSEYGIEYYIPEDFAAFLGAFVLLLLSMLVVSAIFFFLVRASSGPNLSLSQVYVLHHIGQVLRYIPGRFWGFLYQLEKSKTPEARAMITNCNIQISLMTTFGTAGITSFVLTWMGEIPSYLGYSVSVLLFFVLFLALKSGIGVMMFFTRKCLPASFYNYLNSKIKFRNEILSYPKIVIFLSMLIISWMTYFIAWKQLAHAYPVLSEVNLVSLAAWYGLAWLVGFVSALTPGGLGVREASFIMMAAGNADLDLLVFIAAFIRIWFLLADLILGLIALILSLTGKS